MAKKFEISRVVINQAKKMGFSEPVLPTVKKMLINSVGVQDDPTLPVETEIRSFTNDEKEEYFFIICNHVVCSIHLRKKRKPFIQVAHYKCNDCKDTRKVTVYEECPEEGEIRKLIPCQSCSGKTRNFFK